MITVGSWFGVVLFSPCQFFIFWFLQRAIEEGADFIESDILSTKDGALICFHDVVLDSVTDVADHKEFASYKRTYEIQGFTVTGWFTGRPQYYYTFILFLYHIRLHQKNII